jgi:hypothetical protein
MVFPPYCLDCEALLTADDYRRYAAPLCVACYQRMLDEVYAEVAPEIERSYVEGHYLKWGFQTEKTWVWLHPMEFLDWCLGTQADDDPLTAYD